MFDENGNELELIIITYANIIYTWQPGKKEEKERRYSDKEFSKFKLIKDQYIEVYFDNDKFKIDSLSRKKILINEKHVKNLKLKHIAFTHPKSDDFCFDELDYPLIKEAFADFYLKRELLGT